jgi:quinol monooxygenase YgiN
MSSPIIYIDTSEIREGRLEAVKAAIEELAAFIEANNPHVLSYRFFVDENAARMTVVAVHPDSAALEFHMDVGDAAFRKFADLLDLVSIAVYGDVGEAVRERLDRKARMLGRGRVEVHRAAAGFSR